MRLFSIVSDKTAELLTESRTPYFLMLKMLFIKMLQGYRFGFLVFVTGVERIATRQPHSDCLPSTIPPYGIAKDKDKDKD